MSFARICSCPSRVVSILVFVELALDVRCSENTSNNPIVVSILVFVELALDGPVRRHTDTENLEFQSLFSWNLLLMEDSISIIMRVLLGFNPCFRGTCS